MSEQAQVPQTIEPHQAAVEKLLAEANATSSDFERVTFLARCNSSLSRECQSASDRLLKEHRGKLLSVDWDVDFEYDDEGGTYPSVSCITLHLEDGREIPLGDTSYLFDDASAIDDFIVLDYPESKALAETLKKEEVDANEAFTATISEMTGIPRDRIDDYLGVLADYINENLREEPLTLAVQALQKESQDA